MALQSSPRSWGCFLSFAFVGRLAGVFPTLVGVFLKSFAVVNCRMSLPHARGGVSKRRVWTHRLMLSSPRSWGCFYRRLARSYGPSVFPTLVGVFLLLYQPGLAEYCLPHARGGVSKAKIDAGADLESSPRSWGCFYGREVLDQTPVVFPTLVGVFPYPHSLTRPTFSLPHARGGVSVVIGHDCSDDASSPRSWGCFQARAINSASARVFPTLVGVFPL